MLGGTAKMVLGTAKMLGSTAKMVPGTAKMLLRAVGFLPGTARFVVEARHFPIGGKRIECGCTGRETTFAGAGKTMKVRGCFAVASRRGKGDDSNRLHASE